MQHANRRWADGASAPPARRSVERLVKPYTRSEALNVNADV